MGQGQSKCRAVARAGEEQARNRARAELSRTQLDRKRARAGQELGGSKELES